MPQDYDADIARLQQRLQMLQNQQIQAPQSSNMGWTSSYMGDNTIAQQNYRAALAQRQQQIANLQAQISQTQAAKKQYQQDQDRAAAEANRQRGLELTEGFAQSVRDDPRYGQASQAAAQMAQGQGDGFDMQRQAGQTGQAVAQGQGLGDAGLADAASLAGRTASGDYLGAQEQKDAAQRMRELLSGGQTINSDDAIAEYMQRMGAEQGGLRNEADLILNDEYMKKALDMTQATAEGRGNMPFSEQLLQNMQGRFADRTAGAERSNRAEMAAQLAARGQSMSDPGAATALNQMSTQRQTQNLGNLRDLMIQQAMINADASNQASTQLANMRLAQLAQRNPYIMGSAAMGNQAAQQQVGMRAQNAQAANQMSMNASNALASQGGQMQSQQQGAIGQMAQIGQARTGQQLQGAGLMANVGGNINQQQGAGAQMLGGLATQQYGTAWPAAQQAAQTYLNTYNVQKRDNGDGQWTNPLFPGQTQNWQQPGTRSDGWSPTGTTQRQWQNPLTPGRGGSQW